jgi:AcrR family transcriptional regulator
MSTPLGLRERKKQDTRDRIMDVALELFLKRGFDEVSVGEVARVADVATATVFNYFPTKEDLVYRQLEGFWHQVVQVVAQRASGVAPLDAFDEFLAAQRMPAETDERLALLVRVNRMIVSSPSLVAREARFDEEAVQAMAQVLSGSLTPVAAEVTARALAAAHRTVRDVVRRMLLEGADRDAINVAARRARVEAVDLLRRGFAG